MGIKTTRDLRRFLADTMVQVRDGDVDHQAANAISKLCAQINNSLALEVKAAMSAGLSVGAANAVPALTDESEAPKGSLDSLPPDREVWCDQCDGMVKVSDARNCKSKFCKAGQ